jgi:hypothetical protein
MVRKFRKEKVMFRRPETQLARPEVDDDPLAERPKLNEWSPNVLYAMINSMYQTLPNGKNKELFKELRRELSRYSDQNTSNSVLVIQPMLMKFADAPILLSPSSIRTGIQVTISSNDSDNAFMANTRLQSGFLTLYDNENELITYRIAYKKLRLQSIAPLTVS